MWCSRPLCKYYTHNHQTLKWWKRLFVTILDICLLNATIVYNSIPTNSRLSGLEFRVKVIDGLLSTWKYNPAQHDNQLSCSRPSSQHPHFPGRSGKKRNCIVCSTKFKRRQTRMICKHCNKPMCVVPCFEKFHSQWFKFIPLAISALSLHPLPLPPPPPPLQCWTHHQPNSTLKRGEGVRRRGSCVALVTPSNLNRFDSSYMCTY